MKHLLLRCCLGVLVLLAGNAPFAHAEEASLSSERWLQTYYQSPQPERFVEEVHDLSRRGLLAKPNNRPPMIGFLSQVLAQNPQKITAWMTALDDLPAAEKAILQNALWHSGRPEGVRYLESKDLQEYRAKLPPDILTLEITSPEPLDMLWGYFLATGKEAPVRRIISAFNLAPYAGSLAKYNTSPKTEQDKKVALLDATLQAATMSLRSMCKQHARVQEICENLLQNSTLNGLERQGLLTLLGKDKAAQDQPTWRENGKLIGDKPNRKASNGFAAQLFLTEDATFFDNWNKPETPRLNETSKAPRNVPVHTVVLFTNPGLDAAGDADITASITILKPDGSVYAKVPTVICWKGKYATPPDKLQLVQNHMALRIEPQDPVGRYTVQILVRDNVKNVELPLETALEISP